ncbi:MAG: hypothetical protein FWG90_01930 [Oscillospiraceae bacterium]|nr:hypothetical protein [Oscillospiraceae bacterium]
MVTENCKSISPEMLEEALATADMLKCFAEKILDENLALKYREADSALETRAIILDAINHCNYNGATEKHYDIIVSAADNYRERKAVYIMDKLEIYHQQTGNGVDEFTESEHVKRSKNSEYHQITGNGKDEFIENDDTNKVEFNVLLFGEVTMDDIAKVMELARNELEKDYPNTDGRNAKAGGR